MMIINERKQRCWGERMRTLRWDDGAEARSQHSTRGVIVVVEEGRAVRPANSGADASAGQSRRRSWVVIPLGAPQRGEGCNKATEGVVPTKETRSSFL